MNEHELNTRIETGLRALQGGHFSAAVAAFEQALAISPLDPDVAYLMGVALLQSGDPANAAGWLERAVRTKRNQAATIGALAQCYFALGRYPEAYDKFRKSSELDPKDIQPKLGMASALAMQRKFSEAERLLRRLSERFPENPVVWFNYGNSLRDQEQFQQAAETYRRAVSLDSGFIDARNNLANALQSLRDLAGAEAELRECLRRAPSFILAKCNLASVLLDCGRVEEAKALCLESIAQAPHFALAHAFLGTARSRKGRLLDALECHRAAAMLAPHDFKIVEAFATALTDASRFNEGLHQFDRALKLSDNSFSVRWKLCLSLLRHGRFPEGWVAYRQRPHPDALKQFTLDAERAAFLASDLKGNRICILEEQGLGDQIFFLRYAACLRAAGARVICRTSSKLKSLIERVPEIDQVIGEGEEAADVDLVMLAGDLPAVFTADPATPVPSAAGENFLGGPPDFRERIAVFWPHVPPPLRLTPRDDRSSAMRRILSEFGPPPYLAVTWRGGTSPNEQQGRSWMLYKEIEIEPLAGALREFEGTFIALQRNPAAGELHTLQNALGRNVLDLTGLNDDLEDMLALLALVDEYVAVSNTNVHLRSSVGKSTRVLVPGPSDWRWMDAGRTSPWFPECRIYRQSAGGNWDDALNALKRELAGMQLQASR